MKEPQEERKPGNLQPFDFHHEKVALTRMAGWLLEQGWEEAKLSVSPKRAFSSDPLEGVDPVEMNDEFIQRFNGEDWKYRYNFYRDQPGNFDLVARKGDETLIVESKGRSSSNRRGAVAQLVGALTLVRDSGRASIRYAILVPDDPAWDSALRNAGGLEWIELYRIGAAPPGSIAQDEWARHQTEAPGPA